MKTYTKRNSLKTEPVLLSPRDAIAIARLSKLLILDVQNPKYATTTIPKAQQLGVDIALKDIPRTRSILVTCLNGERSLTAARQLIGRGYCSVYVLRGGVMAWRRAAYITQPTKLPA